MRGVPQPRSARNDRSRDRQIWRAVETAKGRPSLRRARRPNILRRRGYAPANVPLKSAGHCGNERTPDARNKPPHDDSTQRLYLRFIAFDSKGRMGRLTRTFSFRLICGRRFYRKSMICALISVTAEIELDRSRVELRARRSCVPHAGSAIELPK